MKRYLILCLAAVSITPAALAQETPDQAKDEAAIRKTGKAYIKAFNSADAAALAEYWSPEAVYMNRLTGEEVVGRSAIAEQFKGLFESAKGLKLDVQVDSIQFVSPNVAVENGVASFGTAKAAPEQISYSAVYVRRDGKWLLDRVTDDPTPAPPEHYTQLQELEWMIGTWVDEDDNGRIETECKWASNNSFITRSFSVAIEGQIDMSGIQIIGWDAATEQIRSWVFDSDGGFSQRVWEKTGDRWSVRKTATLPSGALASSTTLLTPIDENNFTWQQVNRVVDGQLLPNLAEIVVRRR